MTNVAKAVALGLIKTLFWLLRSSLYILLLLLGRLFLPLACLAVGVGLMLFLSCAIIWRDQVTPMWAGAGMAVGAMVLIVMYEYLLLLVAPEGTEIVSRI